MNKKFFNLIKDNKGQLSIEYLLVVLTVILILIAITLPTLEFGVNNSIDMTNILKTKSECVKIADAVNIIYSNGAGSKKTIIVDIPKDTNLNFNSKNVYFDYLLWDGGIKKIYLNCNYNDLTNIIPLHRGVNKIIIEWSIISDKIEISLV
ncbi:MAG: class III signal peptide-containing protein [Methanobrevibacter sp.]|jgi:uncharacterized protein (UPF0333 family)|nr:class III signal peptide-containing protein [Candidatus Methanovirga meridionalis]